MNLLRDMINQNKKILGTLVCLTDPCICEIIGNVGFDCVWIDTEHTYMSYKDVLCHLNSARASGISSIVRLPQNDLTSTKKILEMGPDGVIFPMVRNLKEFNSLMEMTLYPPHGTRGFGPMRAIDYNSENAVSYVKRDSFELCRFVQIESISMIDELEEISKHPFIDGFIFGPNDLSGSAGDFLNVFGDKTVSEIKRAIDILKKSGKRIGVACGYSQATLEFWTKFGFDTVFAGGDWNFIYDQARATLELMKRFEEE
jgi:2-dehydro-3-deoxyglucarate aldolase/4-hydroxy-2-oxoheptanedioate aldolase